MIIRIKGTKTATINGEFKMVYVIESETKYFGTQVMEVTEDRLTKLYREADKLCVTFEVEAEDYIDTDLIIKEYSFDVISDDEIDVYTHVYNLSNDIDFTAVVNAEICETMTNKEFKKFQKNHKYDTWAI